MKVHLVITILVYMLFAYYTFAQPQDEMTDLRIKQPLLFEKQRDIYNRLRKREKLFKFKVPELKIEEVKEEKCFYVKAIRIEGYKLISKEEIYKVASKYVDKCLGEKGLSMLLREINNLYIKKGYITSKAYLIPKNISEGVVDIKIIEGKIEEITGNVEGIGTAFYGLKGKVLNIRDVEVGIEMLNRLESNNATINLEPGSARGLTKVIIKNIQGRRYSINLSLNNFGYKPTGQYLISSRIQLENPLKISDILALSINTTNRQDPNRRSVTNSIDYSFPLHRFLFTTSFSNTTYAQSLKGAIARYSMLTTNNTLNTGFEYKAYHSDKFKFSGGVNLYFRENTTLIEEIKIGTMSYKYNKAKVFLKNVFILGNMYASLTLNVHKGLGSDEDKYVIDIYRNNEVYKISGYFTKFSVEGSLFINLPFRLSYTAFIYGQYAWERLFSSEQISIGGPYSVRGFFEDNISGDTGFYIRNDISGNIRLKGNIFLRPYAGADYGIIDCTRDSLCGAIIGLSAGTHIIYKRLSINVFHSLPVFYPEYIKESGFTGFSLNFSI